MITLEFNCGGREGERERKRVVQKVRDNKTAKKETGEVARGGGMGT